MFQTLSQSDIHLAVGMLEVDTGEEAPAQLLIVVVRLVGDRGAQVWELWWSIKANCPGVRM